MTRRDRIGPFVRMVAIAWFIVTLTAATICCCDTVAQGVDPALKWSSQLVDEVDWVAVVWNWDQVNQTSGQLLSLMVPVPRWTAANGTDAPSGPVLLAGKTLKDGSSRLVVLLPANQVAPARSKLAKPLPATPKAPSTQPTEPSMYDVGINLIAIGSPKLLKAHVAENAPGLSLAALAIPDGVHTIAAIAFRPDVVTWPSGLSVLKDCNSVVIRCDLDGGDLAVDAIAPMAAEQSKPCAAALNDAAHAFEKETVDAESDSGRPVDWARMEVLRIVSETAIFSQDSDKVTAETPASLRARLQIPAARLAEVLPAFINFSTPQAALGANLLARSSGCSFLFLSTLTPQYRSRAVKSSEFPLADLGTPEVGCQYYIDTISEGADRAMYRLRIHDVKTQRDLRTLQICVIRQDSLWMIDSIQPWVAPKNIP